MCVNTSVESRSHRHPLIGTDAGARFGHPLLTREGLKMNLNLTIGPVVSIIAGVLILMVPRLLNYIVAIYLILIGVVGLFGSGILHP